MGGFIPAKALPIIRASGSVLASSAAATTVATYTPSVTGLYRVTWWFDCTAFTSGTVGMTATFTDGNNTARTYTSLGGFSLSGGAGTTLGGTGVMYGVATVWAKGGVAINVSSAISATATGDFLATIEQVQ